MWRNLRLRPILASVLVLAFARGAFAVDDTTVSAETSVYNYAGHMTFTVEGVPEPIVPVEGQTTEVLENFPMLVRIRENVPTHFGYEFIRSTNDIVFLDTKGKTLNYEIETWDPAGESLIWVQVPSMRNGAEITMCWDLRDGCTKPASNDPTAVWSGYTGVWHMKEAADSSPNQAAGTFGTVSEERSDGIFGQARGAKVTGKNGALLVADRTDALDALNTTGFTASFYIRLNSLKADWAYLFSRKTNDDYAGWGLQFAGANFQSGNADGVRFHYSNNKQWYTRALSGLVTNRWQRMDVVMTPESQQIWIDGAKRCEYSGKSAFGISETGFSIGGLAGDDHGTLNGDIDEFRLSAGTNALNSAWIATEMAQTNLNFYSVGGLTNDASAVLKNGWVREPSITKTVWEEGTHPTWDDIDAEPQHGTEEDMTVVIYNRATGVAVTNEIPTAPGSYRVVITVAQNGTVEDGLWGALEQTLGYRIAKNEGSHEFAVNVARILLGNDDYTVDGGEVESQGYDDEEPDSGYPYWKHLDSDGDDASTTYEDYWSDSYDFNLGGGTHHIYRYGEGVDRLWDLRDVRIGNTFNNGELYRERTGRDEEYAEGLASDQNYLPWNPESQRVLSRSGLSVAGKHRYVGHIVMQNTTKAAVTSTCYTNGIGTIYFDAVNGWTDNVTNALGAANYRLVVEIATNTTYDASLPPKEAYVSSNPEMGDKASEPFYKANWVRWKGLRVLRFDGDSCEDLGTTDAVDLKIEAGGNYECFYRVIVPVNLMPLTGGIRFRIRREAIDAEQTLYPDGTAYILLDNIICSEPAACVQLAPYGKYFPEKTRKTALGWEGAFVPAFPSVTGEKVFGRAKATLPDGSAIPQGVISSATMHYRWHYLEQQTTGWREADLVPETLVTREPLELPPFQGDIDFWFDAVQHGHYYVYADYSGTSLGLGGTGYSEEIPAVTNGVGKGWFVRTREGKSDYSELKLLFKTSETGAVREEPLSVVQDNLWRGYYRMTNAFENEIWWRIEAHNKQEDGATGWNWSTNRWYVMDWTDTLPTFPAAGRMSEGTTNSWSRMACDMQTGYLMFQVDETSLGVTVIHADYQAFDKWNDADRRYFTGSSTAEESKSGTSSDVREYAMSYGSWSDTPATNQYWSLNFNNHTIGDSERFVGYKTFASQLNYFNAWQVGKGMWVYNKYREPQSHVALQMAGNGEGYVEFSNPTQIGNLWPRGLESVSFNSRIAQSVNPDLMAYNQMAVLKEDERFRYYVPAMMLTNYTFMTRTCFDMRKNLGFAGNASVSLFAYYRPGYGAYEARWEQVEGNVTTSPYYKTEALSPKTTGQRLVISRWNAVGNTYQETVLYAVTNSKSFKVEMPTMPYVDGVTATNNLMPFCISVYKQGSDTIVLAGVRITVAKQEKAKTGGVSWNYPVGNMGDKWYFACARDSSDQQLESGSYGVLAANCEGMFLTPQWRDGTTYPSGVAPTALKTGYYSNKSLNSVQGYVDSYAEMKMNWWGMNRGRTQAFLNAYNEDDCFGFAYVKPSQTVDVYAADKGTSNWKLLGKMPVDGFGQPGSEPDFRPTFYYTADSFIRLKTGGEPDDFRTDVVINDIEICQWCGWDSDTYEQGGASRYGDREKCTNFVFTTGWVTNGAVQLSAKRTPTDSPCSIRSPLLDGYKYFDMGVGLGGFRFSYREPQTNISLLVQFVTNVYSDIDLLDNLTKGERSLEEGNGNQYWHTVTNLHYKDLWSDDLPEGATNVWSQSFGFHGAKGLMRVIVDPALVKQVSATNWTDTSAFGSIDITSVRCFDEPALDKGCWWGWNIQSVGDARDSQKRMYLPDKPIAAPLDDFGRSLALNNSVTADVNPAEEAEKFCQHMPFLQSPTFTNAVIGQISFKARKYELSDYAPAAQIVVYGADKNPDSLADDKGWTYVAAFTITNTIYTTYTCKTDSQNFYALRLAVVDVPGTPERPEDPKWKTDAQRVLLDDVSVSEAVRAMLSFRNVGAFRTNLVDNAYVGGVTTSAQQPLCDENWGVQAEVFATMLGDEIDMTYTPKVKMHWYVGKEPWGYANWKGIETGSAWLAQTEGSNYVYRSSYEAAPEAVMPAQSEPGTVVQYMLEVEYRTISSSMPGGTPTKTLVTNWLDAASWSVPEWYAPVDYNSDPDYGAGKTFAAFNILDTVAPGWAWINEANVFSKYDKYFENADKEFQYVEVCVPMEADLTGWRIRMLEAGIYNNEIVTNWIARFGSGSLEGKKKDNRGARYNKVFRCVGNSESSRMKKSDGTLDGIWSFSDYGTYSVFDKDGSLDYISNMSMPFGIQLVRPSGIIESSVVVIGTNKWEKIGWHEYDPTNIVRILNQNVPGSKFFYAAQDCCGTFRSGSVTSGQGESASVWTNDWACSPGYINTNWGGKVEQKINPLHPSPQGDSIIVYANLDLSGGPIHQYVGGEGSLATNTTELLILRRGGEGTNILYTVDPWYELASVETNDQPAWVQGPKPLRVLTLQVGKGASNNVNVVAAAQIDRKLSGEYGLTKDNPYTPAAMKWLVGGCDAYGKRFAKYDDGDIALADIVTYNRQTTNRMTLTQMYWLDMDPTVSNLEFCAGMIKTWPETENALGEPVSGYEGQNVLTNVKMRVYMAISNRADHTAWSPYILRGLDADFTSWKYAESAASSVWTSETFKVTGILANGLTSELNQKHWIPLRWFVFDEDSFRQEEGELRFTSDIEIVDPHTKSSAGWYSWRDWYEANPGKWVPVFNSWALDTQLSQFGVDVLQPTNFIRKATSP